MSINIGWYKVEKPKEYYNIVGVGVENQDKVPDDLVEIKIEKTNVNTLQDFEEEVSIVKEVFDKRELVTRKRFINKRELEKLEMADVIKPID